MSVHARHMLAVNASRRASDVNPNHRTVRPATTTCAGLLDPMRAGAFCVHLWRGIQFAPVETPGDSIVESAPRFLRLTCRKLCGKNPMPNEPFALTRGQCHQANRTKAVYVHLAKLNCRLRS